MSYSSGNPIIESHGMEAEVILASQGPEQKPVYTVRARSPRGIWPEFLTHRVFGRNARSSRAVPFKTLAQELRDGRGFTPWHWTANQPGMQGVVGHDELVRPGHWFGEGGITREEAWAHSMEEALDMAQGFSDAGYHKQIYNRLLEPFMMIDALITSTDWENFFWLRDHEAAEPHFQELAQMIREAIDGAKIQKLEPGEWHQPYITVNDRDAACFDMGFGVDIVGINHWLNKISAARCARISYTPFDGNASYERELERYNLLVKSDRVHASPLEHQATPDESTAVMCPPYAQDAIAGTAGRGIKQEPRSSLVRIWDRAHLHGNLTGYIQNRKLVPNESYAG